MIRGLYIGAGIFFVLWLGLVNAKNPNNMTPATIDCFFVFWAGLAVAGGVLDYRRRRKPPS